MPYLIASPHSLGSCRTMAIPNTPNLYILSFRPGRNNADTLGHDTLLVTPSLTCKSITSVRRECINLWEHDYIKEPLLQRKCGSESKLPRTSLQFNSARTFSSLLVLSTQLQSPTSKIGLQQFHFSSLLGLVAQRMENRICKPGAFVKPITSCLWISDIHNSNSSSVSFLSTDRETHLHSGPMLENRGVCTSSLYDWTGMLRFSTAILLKTLL